MTVSPTLFLDSLARAGVDTVLTLPCSAFAGVLDALDGDARFEHLAMTSEAEGVGIAAGAWMSGRTPVLVVQNSGFCDAINPIGSLLDTFKIPVAFFVSCRGGFGVADEPQHALVGERFTGMVKALGLSMTVLPSEDAAAEAAITDILTLSQTTAEPVVIAVPVGALSRQSDRRPRVRKRPELPAKPARPGPAPDRVGGDCGSRREVLATVRRTAPPDSLLVCSTGYIGRELFELGDADTQLYVAGSMGCASAIGFGLARCTSRLILVLDGDGAAVMRLGNMATIGSGGAGRLIHLVFNNGVFESTGGQPNLARGVDFAAVAQACGYSASSQRVHSLAHLADALANAVNTGSRTEPVLLDLMIQSQSPMPTLRPDVSYPDQARRMRNLLTGSMTGFGTAGRRIAQRNEKAPCDGH